MVTVTISRPHRVALRLPRIPAEEVQHPLAPLVEGIVGLEQAQRRHRARPLEGAEHYVIAEARSLAAEEARLHQRRPQRLECAAELGEPLLGIGADFLEAPAEALLARLAKVGPV